MWLLKRTMAGDWGIFESDKDGNPIGDPVFATEDVDVAVAHLNARNFKNPASGFHPVGTPRPGVVGYPAKAELREPYGAVTYADPGYRGDKKRYPLDTNKHIYNAWARINVPAFASLYTADQLEKIKGRIRAAMKRIGAKISEEEKKASEGFQGLVDANYRHADPGEDGGKCCGNCEYWIGKRDRQTGVCAMFNSAVKLDWICDEWESDIDPDDEEEPESKALITGSSTFQAPADTSGGALAAAGSRRLSRHEAANSWLQIASADYDKSEKVDLDDL